MSAPISKSDTVFRQRVLACSGFYTGAIDGDWGPKTGAADDAFHAEFERLRSLIGAFDPRTEAAISTLLIKAQDKARCFMLEAGPTCKILSGTRTYPEQDALYAQGRTAPGNRVTNATAGSSNHNFGIAWDVGIFIGGRYLTGERSGDEEAYTKLADKVRNAVAGLEWGGDWHSIKDRPHYQLATGKTLDQIREAFEAGHPFI